MLTAEIEAYLSSVKIPIRLACIDKDCRPVVLSLWYLYESGKLYCATQASAQVARYLKENPECAFEVAADNPPYCGVRGQGLAVIDSTRGIDILTKLLERYIGDAENAFARSLLARKTQEVAIIIEPTRLSTWNFQKRMANTISDKPSRICP